MKSNYVEADPTKLLPQRILEDIDACISANADRWLVDHAPVVNIKLTRDLKGAQGNAPRQIMNPFYGYIGCTTYWGKYPAFALNIIEGVARLDWNDRPVGIGGKSMPLSVSDLAAILEYLPIVSNEAVEDLLQLRERHARRYLKAIELIIPKMVLSRPRSLRNEMEGIEPEHGSSEWEDGNESNVPSPEALSKLHHDLRTLTKYKTAEEYDAELQGSGSANSNVIDFPVLIRRQHPKKAQALALLEQGAGIRAISRELGVSVNSVRSWKDSLRADEVAA